MKIIVCVKQVPGTPSIETDPDTGVLKRDAVEAKLNPYDLFAIEEALALAERTGGTVTALSMGPPQAKAALLETVYMGADRAVLVSDKAFAGSDVLATSYTLSQAARATGFDIIICGKQTTDGDTAQVGAETAEFMGIPHAANVLSIKVCDAGPPDFSGSLSDNEASSETKTYGTGGDVRGVIVTVGQENLIITQYLPLPCLLCVDGGVNTPRLPSYKRKRGLVADPVRVLSLSDLSDTDINRYGLAGSPTQVEQIYTPTMDISRETITGDGAALAERLAAILREQRFI
jgi:electron transfer flavoprotein beta subunit